MGQKSTKKGLTYDEFYGKRSFKIKQKMKNKKLLVKDINKIKTKFPILTNIEKFKYINGNVHVKCKNSFCEKWFVPSYTQIYERHRALNSPGGFEENNFYCSEECKKTCILYKFIPSSLETTNTFNYKEFIYIVLKRENNMCEYCGAKAEHVHHIRPKKIEPFFSLDPDYALAVCKKCHYKYGHKKGTECSTGNLSKVICSNRR